MLPKNKKISVDVILFDLDNTLFNYDDGEVLAFEKTMKAFDLPLSLYASYKVINKNLWDMLEKGEVQKDVLKIRRFQELLALTSSEIDPKVLADAYLENLANTCLVFDGTLKVIEALIGSYPLIAVTNGIEHVQLKRLELSGFSEAFKAIVISEKIGVNKPHPLMFTYGLEEIAYKGPMDRVLMVGDNYSADILGAKALGMKTCWMNYAGISPSFKVESDLQIQNIEELLSYL